MHDHHHPSKLCLVSWACLQFSVLQLLWSLNCVLFIWYSLLQRLETRSLFLDVYRSHASTVSYRDHAFNTIICFMAVKYNRTLTHLLQGCVDGYTASLLTQRFRPNFLVAGKFESFAEENWEAVKLGTCDFQVLFCTYCIGFYVGIPLDFCHERCLDCVCVVK